MSGFFAELLRSRAQRVALLASSLVLVLVGFLPLFAGPSYEFGLAVGLSIPTIAAISNALDQLSAPWLPRLSIRRALWTGGMHAGLVLVVAMLHALRSGACDPLSQLGAFALGPLFGVFTGATWGALAGLLASLAGRGRSARALAIVLALSGPALGIVVSLVRYYQGPIVFAFDPFVGHFAGTLYDTEIDAVPRLLSYRLGTLGFLLLALGLGDCLTRATSGRLAFVATLPGLLAMVVGGVSATAIAVLGQRLGHVQTAAGIREELGHVATSERCEVVYDGSLVQREVHALARECDAHVRALERYFETEVTGRITVFLFANEVQKAALMGARDVDIAKPWRREVYVRERGYPHPVLAHELAHVVAGTFARGPFRVAGPWGGWIPDPGRIEGFAEAAAPRENDELTILQWAKAMRELELLPPLDTVFRLSFLGENASTAYTVAGAFVHWLKQTHGTEVLRGWYAGEPVSVLTGKTLAELGEDFHAALDALPLPTPALETARARFDRPALFGRRCPHEVDALYGRARQRLSARDTTRARELFLRVLALDPGHFGARLGLPSCELGEGDLADAERGFAQLAADEQLHALWRLHALERAADAQLLAGQGKEAQRNYERVAAGLFDEDARRQVEVKSWLDPGLPDDHLGRRAIVALLLGDPVLGTDWGVSGAALGRWSEADAQLGLADYLLGKNYFQRGRWEEAARVLDAALERKLPLPLVKREALRVRIQAACALGQKARAKEVLAEFLKLEGPSEHQRDSLQRLVQRCSE